MIKDSIDHAIENEIIEISKQIASIVFLICSDETKTWKSSSEEGYTTGEMDASIICTHMILDAWKIGIGSVWVRLFDSKEVSEVFNLPKHIKLRCLLPIEYPSENSKAYALWRFVYRNIEDFTEEL